MHRTETHLANSLTLTVASLALGLSLAACGGDDPDNPNNSNNGGTLTAVRSGTLTADGAGGAPDATGAVSIRRDSAGALFVVLGSDFMQEAGPGDTQLFLAKTADNIQAQRDADPASVSAAIGTVTNGFSGAANYPLPSSVDAEAFNYLIVWCPTAGVNFGVAQLGESSGPTLTTVRQANFVSDGAGGAPNASGSVHIARSESGALYVQLGDNFAQEMGPGDTQLLLARTSDNVQAQRDSDAASVSATLGTIANGASGAQEFMIPSGVNVSDFDYVIVWCPTAGVNFGAAQLPLRSGTLSADGAGGAPDATGAVSFERGEDGKLSLVLGADFAQEMGPGDTQIYLARADGNVASQRDAAASSVSAVIGTVSNGATGTMRFEVPSGVAVDGFDYAIVWCPTAGVNFGAARLN